MTLDSWSMGNSLRSRAPRFYDPIMIHEPVLKLTENAFGSHPCCVISIRYGPIGPFHGGNTGSNPVGDAKIPKKLHASDVIGPCNCM
jgi:hypothetical protein